MQRDMFVRMATTVLAQNRVTNPGAIAEALAAAMDMFDAVLRDAPTPAAAPPQPAPAFPSLPPDAVAPAPPKSEPVDLQELRLDPYTPSGIAKSQPQEQSLIVPATTIPDKVERVTAEPQRVILTGRVTPEPPPPPKPTRRIKVEELNALIQERTPARFTLEVPLENGGTRRMNFTRDVQSQHGSDCVSIVMFPVGATPSVRELTEVQEVIHVDDLPVDLTRIMERLKAKAVDAVRPREAPREVPVRPFSGPVTHVEDEGHTNADFAPQAQELTNQTQAVFRTMG